MRRFTTLSLVVAAGLVAGTAGADIVWTGAVDSDIANDGNYDFSGSGLATIAGIQGATVADNIVYNGTGTAPTLNETAGQPSWGVAAGFSLTWDGVVSGNDGNDGYGQGTMSVINGATATAFFINSTGMTVDGTSTLILQGGGGPLAADSPVNLLTGAVLHFTNEDLAAFNAEHLVDISVNGVALVAGVNATVVSDGGSGTIVTAIVPEPGSLALLGLGGLALLRRRRA